MSQTSIVVAGTPEAPTATLSLSIKAKEIITQAIEVGSSIFLPDDRFPWDADDAQRAQEAASFLKGLASDLDKSREITKAPYWNACTLIQSLYNTEVKPIEKELKRLEQGLSIYARAEQAKIDAENQRRLREQRDEEARQQKIRDDAAKAAADAQRAIDDAARLAKLAEEAKGKKAKEAAQKLADEAAALAKQAEEKADDQQLAAENQTPVAPLVLEQEKKIEGASVRPQIAVEVVDARVFYARYPQLCEIKVNIVALKALANQIEFDYKSIPGVICTEEVKIHVKKSTTGLLQ